MTNDASSTCLYQGRVMHHRLRPVRHRFTYRVFSLYLDLDDIERVAGSLRLLSVERRNLLSFHAADHGARDGSPLRPWVLARLAEQGIALRSPRIRLLCFPRLFGYVFNPISIYFCYDGTALAAVVYEVKNTFGGQHVYAFRVRAVGDGRRLAPHDCAKEFYVSPFIDMAARYEFHLAEPGDRLAVVIKETERGALLLIASQVGDRRPLTDRTILACLAADLFMTFKVFLGIHVEALRLWWKGVPLFPRKPRPIPADVGPMG
ncbi:MAG: DUF1365 domain-containing protein [Geminicoccaceae bacterium]